MVIVQNIDKETKMLCLKLTLIKMPGLAYRKIRFNIISVYGLAVLYIQIKPKNIIYVLSIFSYIIRA